MICVGIGADKIALLDTITEKDIQSAISVATITQEV